MPLELVTLRQQLLVRGPPPPSFPMPSRWGKGGEGSIGWPKERCTGMLRQHYRFYRNFHWIKQFMTSFATSSPIFTIFDILVNNDVIEKTMVLPVDKGRMAVVLDKCQELLKDGKTYQKLKWDLTSKYQDKFKEALSDLKVHGVITNKIHHDLFPTTDQPSHFYGLQKVNKAAMPLWPIVFSLMSIIDISTVENKIILILPIIRK